MNYDNYLAQCVEDYFNEETPDEKQERLESHSYSYEIIALHTGMRLSEIRNLKWSDVFLSKNYLIALNTKNGRSRKLIITPQMKQRKQNIKFKASQLFF